MKSFPIYLSLIAFFITAIFITIIFSSSKDTKTTTTPAPTPLPTSTPSLTPTIPSEVSTTPVHHLYTSQNECENSTHTQCVYVHIDCFKAGPGCGEKGWQKR